MPARTIQAGLVVRHGTTNHHRVRKAIRHKQAGEALDDARVRGGRGDLGVAHRVHGQRFASVQTDHGVLANVLLRTQPDLNGLVQLASRQHLVDVQLDVVKLKPRSLVQLGKGGEERVVERLVEQRMDG